MRKELTPDGSANVRSDSAARRNQRVIDAIRAYCGFRYPQRHALMVSGKWGSGKTHLIEDVIEQLMDRRLTGDSNKPLYITLYGVKDATEIGEQIYQQMHPLLAHKGTRFVGALMKGILKTTVKIDLSELHKGDLSLGSQLPDVKVSELLGGASQRIVVFDDFERAVMSPVELLGYINPLVEHDGCKVIILANEEAIDDADGKYKERKEKTVGQTLQITADVEMALSTFMNEIDTLDLRACYVRNRTNIVAVFTDSKLDNLRLLKQFLWDFERLWSLLTIDQRKHEQAVLEMMHLLFAWTLEVRSNAIDIETILLDPSMIYMALGAGDLGDRYRPLKDMIEKYPSVRFDSTLLLRGTMKGIIEQSEFQGAEIQEQLRAHPYFTKLDEQPAWVSLWHADDLATEAVPGVMRKFDDAFENRECIEEEQIMHVTGLCLWISDLKQPGWEAGTIVAKIKSYIDDVYDNRLASANDVRVPYNLHREFGGAYGLGYRNVNDPRFKEISEYLEKKVADWRMRGLPLLARDLLDLMGRDGEAFLRQVCTTAVGPSTYAQLPVLKSIPADDFVATFASRDAAGRRDILQALAVRYKNLCANEDLSSEKTWLNDVYSKLIAHANELGPIPRGALLERIKYYLEEIMYPLRAEVLAQHPAPYSGPRNSVPDSRPQ